MDVFDIAKILIGELSYLPQGFFPYNTVETEDGYVIELAVAGYDPKNLEVTYVDGFVKIVGKREDLPSGQKYRYKGLKGGNFVFHVPVGPLYTVKEVEYKHGLLLLHLARSPDLFKKLTIKTV